MLKNILLVSGSWASHERSGVAFSTEFHLNIMLEIGHKVSILGSDKSLKRYKNKVKKVFIVKSKGSGAIYSPPLIKSCEIEKILENNHFDLLISEGWQVPLNEAAILESKKQGISNLMISHGVAIFPFRNNFYGLLRFAAWLPYLFIKFNKVMTSIDFLTTLSMKSTSDRFYDRDKALSIGINVKELLNTAHHEITSYTKYNNRLNQCIVIGYFSHVKNQLELINYIELFPKNLKIKFIGKCKGNYFNKCMKKVNQRNLQNRVEFVNSAECNVQNELSNSKYLILCSITEALPITLIESMSAGTPFVSANVGSISSLKGGMTVNHVAEIPNAIKKINSDKNIWEKLSNDGRHEYKLKYSKQVIANKFESLIENMFNKKNP